jgi:signal peptidase I
MTTAGEPPNPYAAPAAALAHDAPPEPTAPPPRRPPRAAAVLAALFAYPFAGAGFYVLGLQRRFVIWTAASLSIWVLLIVGVWAPIPKLTVIALAALVAGWLAPLIGTAIARPGGAVKRVWLAAALLIVVARGANVAIKEWVVEAYMIPSGAMVPNLLVGDRIMVKKGRHAERGEPIVFKFPQDQSTDYVKRVIAVGGDTIEVRGGVPVINGVPLAHEPIAEPCSYQEPSGRDEVPEPCRLVRETNGGRSYTTMFMPSHGAPDHPRTTIADGEVFVMGDNRDNSYDSRMWGTVKVGLIKGKATLTWWSQDPATGVRWSRVGRAVE